MSGGAVTRNIIAFLAACLLPILAFAPGSVAARVIPLQETLCVGGADSAARAMALPAQSLDCSSKRFAERAPFVRTRAEIGQGVDASPEGMVWQTDPSSFDSMLVRFTYKDGQARMIDVDPQMAARNWFVQTRFSVPVPVHSSPLVAVDTVTERPRTANTLREARLVGIGEAREEHDSGALLYALLCGILLVPIFYDLLFYRPLGFRFMIWHAAMTASVVAFVVSNTGLIFRLFPSFPLEFRFQLNTLSLALALAAAVFFVRDLLEDGTVPRWLGRLTIGLTLLVLVAKLADLPDIEALRIVSHKALLLSILPLGCALLAIIAVALTKRSRVAAFLLIGFSGLFGAGLIRILMALEWYEPSFHIDDLIYLSMAILVLATSAAVGDRFMVLRAERDRARVDAIKLGRMAMSDPLTGLGNRRAFNTLRRIGDGQALLLADIDHFKAINDSRGHLVGDAVLCEIANLMRRCFDTMPGSSIYRLGGEEFAVVFPCEGPEHMRTVAEKLRHTIDANIEDGHQGTPHVTISVGAALGRNQPIGSLFEQADAALYRAKEAGRNRSAVRDDEGNLQIVAAG